MNRILFTPTKVQSFRAAYGRAVKDNADQFVFEEQEVLTAYAEYLLQYLEGNSERSMEVLVP